MDVGIKMGLRSKKEQGKRPNRENSKKEHKKQITGENFLKDLDKIQIAREEINQKLGQLNKEMIEYRQNNDYQKYETAIYKQKKLQDIDVELHLQEENLHKKINKIYK